MLKAMLAVSWITRLVAAGILAMAGFMKISGDPGSVYLMQDLLGAPSFARLGLGGAEVLTALLLLIPRLMPFGTVAAMALMIGAIGSHLFKLGVSIQVPETAPDGVADAIGGPTLFAMAVVVFLCALATAFIKRGDFPFRKCDPEIQ